ncbi:MAG: translesion DNA synthesis-associated protein ImuA [Proteobacteria bacterium]|nr:translesion DNA synthesis-associated protein ImuA [Pseudomonadota bacterium]
MADPTLARLLEHPALWRGRSAARIDVVPSGLAALDEQLPGGGWPRSGLIEILIARFGSGELSLLLPALAALTRAPAARWCVWVAPPLMPFAPALVARGVVLDRVAVVGGERPLWAFGQVLGSGACDAALAWARQPQPRELRRLQLAAERGRTLGVLFRPRRAAREASAAMLRLGVEARAGTVRIEFLKGRGATHAVVELAHPDLRAGQA